MFRVSCIQLKSNNSFNDFIFSKSQNDKFIKNHITYSKNYKPLKIDYSNVLITT